MSTSDGDAREEAPENPPARASSQRVVRVPGTRRAKLTPVAGAGQEPVPGDDRAEESPEAPTSRRGPNDDRLRRDVPPHYGG